MSGILAVAVRVLWVEVEAEVSEVLVVAERVQAVSAAELEV